MTIRRSEVKDFYKQFNVRVRFVKGGYAGANADYIKRLVTINAKFWKRNNDIYKTHLIMHELCHILSADHNKYKKYYTQECLDSHIRKIGLRAERYCDKMADKFIQSLFPGFPCDVSYRSKASQKWYHKNYLNKYFPGGG